MKELLETIRFIDWDRYWINILKFTAPALVVFFTQLALKVDWRAAAAVGLLTLYGALADFFRKYNESKATKDLL